MFKPTMNNQGYGNDSRFRLGGDFDGLRTFQEISRLMPPVGSLKRLILDFSHVQKIKPIEVYALLAEMAAVPRFQGMKITLEGLRFDTILAQDSSDLMDCLAVIS